MKTENGHAAGRIDEDQTGPGVDHAEVAEQVEDRQDAEPDRQHQPGQEVRDEHASCRGTGIGRARTPRAARHRRPGRPHATVTKRVAHVGRERRLRPAVA